MMSGLKNLINLNNILVFKFSIVMETFNLFNKRKTIVEDNEFDDFIKKKPIRRKTNINSLSNIRIVDEEKLKKMERDDIMSHLGCFKLSEEEKSVF